MADLRPAILRRSPLLPAAKLAAKFRLRVLAYHAVTDAVSFERQLDHVQNHYVPVSLDQVLSAIGGARLPGGAVLVTFDDGHRSWVDHVAPAMRARSIPGIAFVASGAIGSNVPYWWEEVEALISGSAALVTQMKLVSDHERLRLLQDLRCSATVPPPITNTHLAKEDLRALAAAGLEIGNHTVTHPLLDRCDISKVTREVHEAKEVLEELAGHKVRSFAYPNGNHAPDVRNVVAESGHAIAFLFDHATQVLPAPDIMAVSRIRVNADDSLDKFAVKVSGLHGTIHRLRQKS